MRRRNRLPLGALLLPFWLAIPFGGGDDIDPKLYAGEDPGTGHYDPARDRFEMAVIEAALREGLPMLGICRGAQLINVVHGGDLIGDLRPVRKHTGNRRLILPRKTLHIQRGSRLVAVPTDGKD